ncbi:unnamed protein product [Strongylus vulgaris]|uniref:Uncharacterized protein n=1 Tax=Strongylus vulgaris TaxID=40348 RepID=A0A3P7KXF2_STRVU|nr:unnamed protein product [Strongylus vulgaris]
MAFDNTIDDCLIRFAAPEKDKESTAMFKASEKTKLALTCPARSESCPQLQNQCQPLNVSGSYLSTEQELVEQLSHHR